MSIENNIESFNSTHSNRHRVPRNLRKVRIASASMASTPKSVTRPRSAQTKRETLSAEQLRALVDAITEDPTKVDQLDIVRLISNTGLGLGELRRLRWTDVDFANSRIAIARKMWSDTRYVPFGPKTALFLMERQQRGKHDELVLAPSPSLALRRTALLLNKVAGSVGLTRVTFGMLCHTFISRLVASGVYIGSLVAIMGYRTPLPPPELETARKDFAIIASEYAHLEEI